MSFDGVETVVCDGTENDWLDVTYSERNYVTNRPAKRAPAKQNLWRRMGRKWQIVSVVCLCVLALVGVIALSPSLRNGVVETAKNAYSAVVSALDGKQNTSSTKFDIPCNLQLKDVKDGVATFGGGRAALAFCAGKVVGVDENSVTVQIDEQLKLCYGGLTAVYVKEGDAVAANQLLGKYDGAFTATVLNDQTAVTDVVATDESIAWNV